MQKSDNSRPDPYCKLIYEDLRVEADSLKSLDLEIIKALAPGYGKKVTTLFARWLEKEICNA